MNELQKITDEMVTMSSREIAELTNKDHAHVMRDIRNLQEELSQSNFGFTCKEAGYKDVQGKVRSMYELDKEATLTLISGYSASLRMAIIKRWQELEKTIKVPQTFKEALLLAVEQQEKIEQQQLQIENLDTVLDNLLEWVSILKVAKHNKVHEKKFNWRELKETSTELGYLIKKAESPRYGFQNLYHINVFRACYPEYNYNLKK
jgi:Rha family phage regulatory protein